MDTNDIKRQYESALESSKWVRNVIEAFDHVNIHNPSEVRADALYWTRGTGVRGQVVAQQDQISFLVFRDDRTASFLATAKDTSDIERCAKLFANKIVEERGDSHREDKERDRDRDRERDRR